MNINYRHILLANVLDNDSGNINVLSEKVAEFCCARLSLLYIVDKSTNESHYSELLSKRRNELLMKKAKNKLNSLGDKLNVPTIDRYFFIGEPVKIINDLIRKIEVDLLISEFTYSPFISRTQNKVNCAILHFSKDTIN